MVGSWDGFLGGSLGRGILVGGLGSVLAFVLSSGAFAQRMPPPSKVADWRSPENVTRLALGQEALPEYRAKELPDGSTEAPRAPWPFLLLVADQPTDDLAKLEERVLGDTRFVLATHAVKLVRIRPEQALELSYLSQVSGLRDPSLIGIDRDFGIVEVLNSAKKFDDRGVLPLLEKLAKPAYDMKLAAYVGGMVAVMKESEEVWRDEEKLATIQEKAGQAAGAAQARLDAESDELEAAIAARREELAVREDELRSELRLKEEEQAAPSSFGRGLSKRELTPEEVEAISSFREFARNDNPIVRAAAVEDLGAIDSDAIVDVVLKATKDRDDRVIRAAGRALGRMRSDAALAAITQALTGGDARAKAAALYGFAEIERPWPPARAAITAALGNSSDDVRRAAIQALVKQGDPAAADGLRRALDDKVPALRVMAAEALGTWKAESAVPDLCAKLTDSDWSLQKAAAEALGSIRSRESIVPLLERFEAEEGVMLEALHKALVGVTGQDFSLDPPSWRRWWDTYGEEFQLPTDEQIAEARRRAEESMAKYARPDKKRYHEIETLSKRMVFVIDVSASMNEKIRVPPGATDEQLAAFPSRVKMDIAKNELIELLGNLERDVKFNIITFAGKVDPWKKSPVGASSRTSAIKYVAKLQAMQAPTSSRRPGGAVGGEEQKTNTYGALLAAFGVGEDGTDWQSRPDVDTVFLVTDGLPTTGEIVDVPKLIETITELNKGRGLTLHLVMFDEHDAKRLRPLADRNGGKCVVREIR